MNAYQFFTILSLSGSCLRRSAKWQGPAQDVQITRAKQYVFTSYIKLLTDLPGVKYQTAQITIRFTLSDGRSCSLLSKLI